jgi:hypothetical protein
MNKIFNMYIYTNYKKIYELIEGDNNNSNTEYFDNLGLYGFEP